MKYRLIAKVLNNENYIIYIIYDNGKMIELSRDEKYNIRIDNNYVFLLLDYKLDKVFDINNKRFITKSFEMNLLYNKFKNKLIKEKRKNKKKILKPQA